MRLCARHRDDAHQGNGNVDGWPPETGAFTKGARHAGTGKATPDDWGAHQEEGTEAEEGEDAEETGSLPGGDRTGGIADHAVPAPYAGDGPGMAGGMVQVTHKAGVDAPASHRSELWK